MRRFGILSLSLGLLLLGLFGVFSLSVIGRHERAIEETETGMRLSRNPTGNGQPELLQGQRDKLNTARTIQLASGAVGGCLLIVGAGLVIRQRKTLGS